MNLDELYEAAVKQPVNTIREYTLLQIPSRGEIDSVQNRANTVRLQENVGVLITFEGLRVTVYTYPTDV